MKIVHLQDKDKKVEVNDLVQMARKEPLLLLTEDGQEFVLSPADDFEKEVESLQASSSFQSFLEERAKNGSRIPLSDIEKEIDAELNARP